LFIAGVTDPRTGGMQNPMDPPLQSTDVIRRSSLLSGVAAVAPGVGPATVDNSIVTLAHALVTPDYFTVLGVQPYIGTFFNGPDTEQQAVISHRFWLAHYGGSASAVGRRLLIDGSAFTVVGVAPDGMVDPAFASAPTDDVWTLFPKSNGRNFGYLVMRARDGVQSDAINADLKRLWDTTKGRHWQSYPPSMTALRAFSVRDAMLQNAQAIWIFFAAAAALLLVVCANVANLVLGRALKRRDQFAVRAALGATVRRIAAQNITETLLLCALGCGLGIGLAAAFMRPALALLPGNLPRLNQAHLDAAAMVYVGAIGVCTLLAVGIAPAFAAARKHISTRNSRTGAALIALEVAAAFALLVCSVLLLRSFLALTGQQLGFEPHRAYAAVFMPQHFNMTAPQSPNAAAVAQEALRQVGALPGVQEAALGLHTPFLQAFDLMTGFWRIGTPQPSRKDKSALSEITTISPAYFSVMQIPIISGRTFTRTETAASHVIVVNHAFARKYFGDAPALGQQINTDVGDYGSERIVGIVADTRDSLVATPKPMAYFPYNWKWPVFVVVFRINRDGAQYAKELAALTSHAFPQYRVPGVTSLEQAVSDDAAAARASFLLLAALTGIAVVVALAGVYGVVAFSVERRFHEIGIRLALGATSASIFLAIVRVALLQSAAGIAIGIAVAALCARQIRNQLFQTSPLDAPSFMLAVLLTLVCVIAAAAIPSLRASRVDPSRSLRYE
jgi:predicted permease